jgi:hypothetical protein
MTGPSRSRDQRVGSAVGRPRHRKEGLVVDDRNARIARLMDRLESTLLTPDEREVLKQQLAELQALTLQT